MTILGVSCLHHDAALTVISGNGNIMFAGHSERYSKRKNDKYLDIGLIHDAREWGPFDTIAYYEKPWLKRARYLYAKQWGLAWNHDPKEYLRNCDVLRDHHQFDTWHHHKSHAAAGFQTSPFNDAIVVVIDAIGEFTTASIWKAEYYHPLISADADPMATVESTKKARYTMVWDMSYPESLGLLYSTITRRVGLNPMDEEYITMGMAAYGMPRYTGEVEQLLNTNLHRGVPDDWLAYATNEDLAASVQQVIEDKIIEIVDMADCVGASTNLVYAGGCALNCVVNSAIARSGLFKSLWIMPAPGDAGSSLGAAALSYGGKINWDGPMLGKLIGGEYPVNNLMRELNNSKIVGVANGRAEFGPRALGNRSLLADPRGDDVKLLVNNIKQRQRFRPFAPVIMAEHIHDYFDMPVKSSPYMQYIARCKAPEKFPAIVHVDNTSRVQTVTYNQHPGLYTLLQAWYKETGCPMLLNTSLNVRGKPMVNDLVDAIEFENTYGVKVCS